MKFPVVVLSCLLLTSFLEGADKTKNEKAPREAETFLTDVPVVPFDVILGRPATNSIVLNIRSDKDLSGVIECGKINKVFSVKGGESIEVTLENLTSGRHEYKIGNFTGSFQLARPSGESFTFTIQADSHLDGSCIPALYKIMLENIAVDKPDFHIDLGDTFMTGKHPTRESGTKQYLAQRYYFALIGKNIPLYLVLGNHDGEEIKRAGETELADWARTMRKKYFPNPEPDNFYSGNPDKLQNYYAWEWGDALFVALDPYTYSTSTRGDRAMENMKLGDKQFSWLEDTLKKSKAKYKFIFIHQLTGGLGSDNRGGGEAAKLHEWSKVHELLVRTKVNVVFHGHDHFYAKQEVDGVIYQLVPQGAHRNSRKHFAEEYGYKSGDFLPNNGHLRVMVSPEKTTVYYINAAAETQSGRAEKNGAVKREYSIKIPDN